jgi:hypothetical protein
VQCTPSNTQNGPEHFAFRHILIPFYRIVQAHVPNREEAVQQLFSESVKAVALDANEPLAHSALGLAYMETGKFDWSIERPET